MHPFGGVHRLEIGSEGTRQGFGIFGAQPGQRIGQLVHRSAFAAPADRRDAYLFDPLEESFTALLGQHAPDHGTEPAHIFAQRAVVRQKFGFAAFFHAVTPVLG